MKICGKNVKIAGKYVIGGYFNLIKAGKYVVSGYFIIKTAGKYVIIAESNIIVTDINIAIPHYKIFPVVVGISPAETWHWDCL